MERASGRAADFMGVRASLGCDGRGGGDTVWEVGHGTKARLQLNRLHRSADALRNPKATVEEVCEAGLRPADSREPALSLPKGRLSPHKLRWLFELFAEGGELLVEIRDFLS
jgi:hypothetical protein